MSDLVLDILGADDVNAARVHRDEAAHGQHSLGRLAHLAQVLLEDLHVLRVEEDVDLLVLLVLGSQRSDYKYEKIAFLNKS
jgi:hypothetical protein